MIVAGLISGSSLDGLDVAVCSMKMLSEGQITHEVLFTKTFTFRDELCEKLASATSANPKELLELEVQFSKFCAESVNSICESEKYSIDYIASHGHTVFHHPENGFTYQIGNGGMMAELSQIPCITDFRQNDVALGGQGAPVAPIVENYLMSGADFYINLGGIANLSSHGKDQIVSFDNCPCNQILNRYSRLLGAEYDKDGRWAREGSIHDSVLEQLSQIEYFHQDYPKSMDNSWVHEVFYPILHQNDLSPHDALATMVEFIAIQLTKDARLFVDDLKGSGKALATGGGALNSYLMERIEYHFAQINLELIAAGEELINFKEAVLIALMGFLRIHKMPNTLPSVTGAKRPTSGGAIYWSASN